MVGKSQKIRIEDRLELKDGDSISSIICLSAVQVLRGRSPPSGHVAIKVLKN